MVQLTNRHKRFAIPENIIASLNLNNGILPLILVFCIPVLLYLQTLTFGFTYFDDDKIIINNIAISF